MRAEAVLLAVGTDRMRVAVAGFNETEEWARYQGVWYDEAGAPVEVQAILAVDGVDTAAFCADAFPRTLTMGRY
jgi:hypothetical protein